MTAEDQPPFEPAEHGARGHPFPLEYHRILLDDAVRLDAFERAIRALVRPGDVVLDLGSGTGILGLLAARRGAARVHAVESAAVAALAVELARANGFADRFVVYRADAAAFEPVEPVDLVLSDFMGRFVVDDYMLPAMAAAGRWLKPGGRFCPSRVRLFLAPVEAPGLRGVEIYEEPIYGLTFGPARPYAANFCYGIQLAAGAPLAPAAEYHEIVPPAPPGTFDRALRFVVARAGRLAGVAGWFDSDLAPGIVLSTAPGIETHWGQYLFPVPACAVEPGDRVSFRLRIPRGEPSLRWCWEGEVVRGRSGERLAAFALESEQRLGERAAPEPRAPPPPAASPADARAHAVARSEEARRAFVAGRFEDAVRTLESAVAALGPAEDDLAPPLHENLGLAYLNLGRPRPAVRAFLRALDGRADSREQSLRFLVRCLAQEGRVVEAARFLAAYEAAFGPHPDRRGPPGSGPGPRPP